MQEERSPEDYFEWSLLLKSSCIQMAKSYVEQYHNFCHFLSPEKKGNERKSQKPITLTVRELYELCNPSPRKDAWERGNGVQFQK